MANGHGGQRTPANPAPASGPGRLSQRTDGGPAQKLAHYEGGGYGDGKAMDAQQRGAAMAQVDNNAPAAQIPSAPPAAAPQGPAGPVQDFGAASAYPDQPVTTGVDIGAGGGSELLPGMNPQLGPQGGAMAATLRRLAAQDTTGLMVKLYQEALTRGV